MKTATAAPLALATTPNVHAFVEDAVEAVTESFEQFCLMAGIGSLTQLMNEDVDVLAGQRYGHCPDKPG